MCVYLKCISKHTEKLFDKCADDTLCLRSDRSDLDFCANTNIVLYKCLHASGRRLCLKVTQGATLRLDEGEQFTAATHRTILLMIAATSHKNVLHSDKWHPASSAAALVQT